MEKGIILPSLYLAPIAYYGRILHCDGEILLETHENFPKQTYRNRATIHAANGSFDLTVPIKKNRGEKRTLIKDVQISYDEDWQRMHWLTLQSAYRRSAYFEFYEDDFVEFYKNKYNLLLEFNQEFNSLILRLLKISREFTKTTEYLPAYSDLLDLRTLFHKKENLASNTPYFQVFEPKNGFIPNLSIVDLLFNQGPHSKSYL